MSCHQSVYADQATQDPDGQPLCQQCFLKSVMVRKLPLWERSVAGSRVSVIHFIELLAVIAIIGFAASSAIPTVLQARDAARANMDRLDSVGEHDTDLGDLASKIQAGVENWELLVERASVVAAVAPEEQEEFEAELQKYRKFSSAEEQKGAIIQTIRRWKRKVSEEP